MKTAVFLSFLAILKLSAACLVIGFSEPPPCACQAKKLDPSNIFRSLQNNRKYYYNVTKSMIKAPELVIEDCIVSMYCEGEYKLFIFDTDKEEFIGDYSVDGYCNSFAQQWHIDTGEGTLTPYTQLMGVCVLKTQCPCPHLQLDNSNAKYYLENSTYYNTELKYYRFQPATVNKTTEDGCQQQRTCPVGLEPRTYYGFDNYVLNTTWTYSTCRPNYEKPWYLEWYLPWVRQISYTTVFAPLCVDFSQRIEP